MNNRLEYSTQTRKNIPTSQDLMKTSMKMTTHCVTQQTHTETKKMELHTVCSDQQGLKLELDKNSSLRNPKNQWKLNSKLLNHAWVKVKYLLKLNKNEGTLFPNLWSTMKAVLRGKFIAHTERSH